MGKRGPTTRPDSVRGAKKAAEAVTESKPRPVRPKCPKYLSKTARREWKRIVPELDRMGLLTCVDGAALECYCNAYSNMVEAQKAVDEKGFTMFGAKGITKRPEVAVVEKAQALIRTFCVEFGLTPSARARMAIPGKAEEEDEMDAFLKGG